jgi:hypothetical protein
MKNQAKLTLNLASNPMRNRRLFFLLGVFLLSVFIGTTILGAGMHVRYKNKRKEVEGELHTLQKNLTTVKRQDTRYRTLIEQKLGNTKTTSDTINSLIYRKNFPWIDFFAAMEEALPESSYIVSLTPSPADGTEMEVRFKAVFTNLKELLQFVQDLESKGFDDVNIVSESQSAQGFLISEFSVRYERHV